WVFEYTWNVDHWDELAIGSVVAGLAHGIYIGPGRADGLNNIYVASTASGSYELHFAAGAWTIARLGDSGDIANLSVGIGRSDGRNDGKTRLYASSFNHNVYEYSF